MNQPSRLHMPVRARAAVLVPLLVVLFASFALVPAAQATAIDAFNSAFDLTPALSSVPYTFSEPATDVSTYTRDAVEADGLSTCGNYPPNPSNTYSVWYRFLPATNGWLTLQTTNAATNYDTVIEVWHTAPQLANSVGCNDDATAGTRRSELTIPVAGGTPYLIAIRRHGSAAMVAPMLAFNAQFSATRELFVDQSNGNDANTGSQVLPLRTVARAEQILPAAGGTITILDPGVYNEAVTLNVPTQLRTASGTATIASLTLAASPVTVAGAVDASAVTVQPGAHVQEGVDLAASGGLLRLADGTYTETVTIARDLTVQAINLGQATIAAPGGVPVTLAGGAVTLMGLNLRGATGVAVTGGANHIVSQNNIAGNTSGVGLENQTTSQVDGTRNWWGSSAGPLGAGDDANGNVLFRPWCDSPVPQCTNVLGAATHLRFTSSPANTRTSTAFAAQPVVQAVDDQGTLDPTFTGAVTLALKGGTAGATLLGTVTVNAISGAADFSGAKLAIDYVGQGYQLAASSGALNSTAAGDSAAFDITADRLVVTSSPNNPTTAGTPLALTAAAQDAFGHTDTTFGGAIALAIQAGPGGASLQGTASKAAVNGVAVFGAAGDANILQAGTAYVVRASASTLLPGDSAPFDIASGPAARLVFATSPSNSMAGVPFPTQPVVEVQDAAGNPVLGYSGTITLTIATNPVGGTLAGTAVAPVVNGQATFSGLSIDKAGLGYTLQAASSSFAPVTSAPFDITAGPAVVLVFTATPGNTRVNNVFLSQPVLEARDAYGNRATSFTGAVALAIKSGTGTAGAALSGTTTINAANGLASFSGLSINRIGTGYQLTATASGLPAVDSTSFDITANALVFTLQPVSTVAGQNLLVKVAAQDAAGTVDTSFNGPVTIGLKNNQGRNGVALFGITTITAVNGLADFTSAGLNIHTAGSSYVLVARGGGLADAESNPFEIFAGAASKLVITNSPADTPADAIFTLELEARDAFGNLDATFTGTVDLAIQTNPSGGILGGNTSKAAVNGVVSFDGTDALTIDRVGAGYVLRASSGTLTPGDTQPFNITANRLVFAVEPSDTPVGSAISPYPVVRAVDRFGLIDTTFNGTVALTIKSGTGTPGAGLRGLALQPIVHGAATLSNLSIDRMGTGYQLQADAMGLEGATSAPFAVGHAMQYVPMAIVPAAPDLIGSFVLSKPAPNPYEPVVVTATITNTGDAPASNFWVDFYINPLNPPTGTNQPWDKRCGSGRCRYGIAWFVQQTLEPGQSITLTSTKQSYTAKNTDWPGFFVATKLDLYLYVDSWNGRIAYGAVYERHEDNNRAELHIAGARSAMRAAARDAGVALPVLPAR